MKNEFDINSKLIYLNSANLSFCPTSVLKAIEAYRADFEQNPTQGLAAAWGHLWTAQSRLASFLRADPNDLFLRSNVTHVLNTFILGTKLPTNSEILVGELEYGAIMNVCRLRAERDHLKWRILEMPCSLASVRKLDETSLVEHVISQLSPDTRLFVLSHVLGGTGLVLPIKQIARETRRRGVFLVIDGAYAPGAMRVDFTELQDVDFYGCSLYKWMLGPKGTAFGWLAPRNRDTLQPLNAGWATFENFAPYSEFGHGDRFQSKFLMTGCHDFAPFRAISDTVDFWDRHGEKNIRNGMEHLRLQLTKELAAAGWQPMLSSDSKLNGPLTAYLLPSPFQAMGARFPSEALKRFGIQLNAANFRGFWHAIFSPHIYNTGEEISAAVRALTSGGGTPCRGRVARNLI